MFYYLFNNLWYNYLMFDLTSPTVYIPTTFIILVAIFVSILQKDAKKLVHENTKDLPYYGEIKLSMNYINNAVLDDGRFQYRKNVSSDITYDNNVYNSLRHAGTLYSMYMYEKLGLENKFHESRIKASKYFVQRYIKKIGRGKYAVISIQFGSFPIGL